MAFPSVDADAGEADGADAVVAFCLLQELRRKTRELKMKSGFME